MLLLATLALLGCKKDSQPAPTSQATDTGQSTRAAVPLRVWFVGEAASQAIIERQWQATSERPLHLRMLTSDDLLKSEKLASDVVVYPAHLIGELVARGWLTELPRGLAPSSLSADVSARGAATSSTQASSAPAAGDQPASDRAASGTASSNTAGLGEEGAPASQPAAWIDQTRYGRSLWGLSLGATAPVIMTNLESALPEAATKTPPTVEDAEAFWRKVVETLSEASPEKENHHAAFVEADHDAVCDRFLALLASLSPRESRFGTLLDPETLEARLAEPEFVSAAEVMLELHQLNAAPEAMAGSYQAAWQALSGDRPAVSIGVPPLATPDVDKITSIEVSVPPASRTSSSVRSAMSERTMGWNSGHGLVASLTTECRQTSLSIEFVRWLGNEANRNAFARSVDGISAQAVYAPGSSAWQAQRLSQRILQQPRLPNQPRLPGSAEYRRALGEQLVRMLRGEQEPQSALKAAAAAWDEITAERDQRELRESYEASLGL